MSRSTLWTRVEPAEHFGLIDDALDKNDDDHQLLRGEHRAAVIELRAEMKAGFDRCEADSKAMRRLLIGLLVTIVGSSVGIMFTVLVAGAS